MIRTVEGNSQDISTTRLNIPLPRLQISDYTYCDCLLYEINSKCCTAYHLIGSCIVSILFCWLIGSVYTLSNLVLLPMANVYIGPGFDIVGVTDSILVCSD